MDRRTGLGRDGGQPASIPPDSTGVASGVESEVARLRRILEGLKSVGVEPRDLLFSAKGAPVAHLVGLALELYDDPFEAMAALNGLAQGLSSEECRDLVAELFRRDVNPLSVAMAVPDEVEDAVENVRNLLRRFEALSERFGGLVEGHEIGWGGPRCQVFLTLEEEDLKGRTSYLGRGRLYIENVHVKSNGGHLPGLVRVSRLDVSAARGVDLPDVEEVDILYACGSDGVSLGSLARVVGPLGLGDANEIDLPNLRVVGTDINLRCACKPNLPLLEEVGGSIDAMESVSVVLPRLRRVGGPIDSTRSDLKAPMLGIS